MDDRAQALLELTADIVSAHVANNPVPPAALPDLIAKVHGSLAGLGAETAPVEPLYEPAVSVRSSVKPDHIVSLIDGKPYRMLKRHLSQYGLTPDQYRARYGLKSDYPMVAPSYAEKRRELAMKIGLGRKRGKKVAVKSAAKPRAARK